MFQLQCFRPEVAEVTPLAEFKPFSGIESLGLFETEEAVHREITYWQNNGGKNWKFMYSDAPEPLAAGWTKIAGEVAQGRARTAASWVTNGNSTDEHRRYVLDLIKDGDPVMDTYLPVRPELGVDYSANNLVEEVTGRQWGDVEDADRETIIGAWETSMDENFVSECEKELLKWVSE